MGISVPNFRFFFSIYGITPQELQISGYRVGYNIALVLLHKTAYLAWPYPMCGDRYFSVFGYQTTIYGITPQELHIPGHKVGYYIALVLLHKTAYLPWPYHMCGDRYLSPLSLFLGISLLFME
jgi:hypothetical protein